MSAAEVRPLRAVEDAPALPAKPTTKDLALVLAAQDSYAVGAGRLYVFSNGCYRPGERYAQQRIVDLLEDGWSRRKAEEIITYTKITSSELLDRPPAGTINVANGLLDIATRELRPHAPEHLSPVQVAAAYDPDARCPAIEAFLQSTIPTLSPLFMELVGYLLTADNRFQRAFMFIGPGGTGKSTASSLIRAALGSENVSSVALHALEEDRFATADLYGRLANIFADLPAHALKASSIFKSITGGDRIRGERKHCPAFEFTPFARLIFSANEAPPTADNSDAFFDRWTILPFEHRHRGSDHQDHHLLAKLTTPSELSGLLNDALDGLDRLRTHGRFTTADSSEEAAQRFRVDSDSAAGFCEDCCTITADARTAKPILFQAYRAWCEENGRRPLAAVRFGRRLRELHDLDQVSSKGKDFWIGIELDEERS
jgi:putative DNA primase/helicase